MTPFTSDQWIIVALVFLLGLLLGMFFMAGSRWKRRYYDELRLREETEAENARLRTDAREMDSLRGAAVKSGHRDPDVRPL